jgi:hypothetical protein
MRNLIAPDILRKTAQRLFYLNATLWLLIALASLARIPTSSALPPLVAGIVTEKKHRKTRLDNDLDSFVSGS